MTYCADSVSRRGTINRCHSADSPDVGVYDRLVTPSVKLLTPHGVHNSCLASNTFDERVFVPRFAALAAYCFSTCSDR